MPAAARFLPIVVAALLLGAFGVLGAGLVAFTYEITDEQIAENERQALLRIIDQLVPPDEIDNQILGATVEVNAPARLGADSTTVYLGRRQGEPAAAVFSPVVARGYGGPIRLIVAVRADGTLGGVRVLAHKETPGLGDKIEAERSDWILGFDDRSLVDPVESRWTVKRDNGVFDQFTGATITPRAVVEAVRETLRYAGEHWGELFAGQQIAEAKP
jgi:electron transport complex protein RnfG